MSEITAIPRMMTIREVAKTGILPENTLRQMVKRGELPCLIVGQRKKALINFDSLVDQLQHLKRG